MRHDAGLADLCWVLQIIQASTKEERGVGLAAILRECNQACPAQELAQRVYAWLPWHPSSFYVLGTPAKHDGSSGSMVRCSQLPMLLAGLDRDGKKSPALLQVGLEENLGSDSRIQGRP